MVEPGIYRETRNEWGKKGIADDFPYLECSRCEGCGNRVGAGSLPFWSRVGIHPGTPRFLSSIVFFESEKGNYISQHLNYNIIIYLIYWVVELYQREKTPVIYGNAGCYWLVELLHIIQMLNCFPLIHLLIYYVKRETPKREIAWNLWKSPTFLPYHIVELCYKGILG